MSPLEITKVPQLGNFTSIVLIRKKTEFLDEIKTMIDNDPSKSIKLTKFHQLMLFTQKPIRLILSNCDFIFQKYIFSLNSVLFLLNLTNVCLHFYSVKNIHFSPADEILATGTYTLKHKYIFFFPEWNSYKKTFFTQNMSLHFQLIITVIPHCMNLNNIS